MTAVRDPSGEIVYDVAEPGPYLCAGWALVVPPLEALTVAELRILAGERGITLAGNSTKAAIIAALG